MTFDIKFSSQAARFLRKLDAHIVQRLKDAFVRLGADDPFDYVEHFEGDYYKFRIGDYRALVDIDAAAKIIWVRVLDKRSRIYK